MGIGGSGCGVLYLERFLISHMMPPLITLSIGETGKANESRNKLIGGVDGSSVNKTHYREIPDRDAKELQLVKDLYAVWFPVGTHNKSMEVVRIIKFISFTLPAAR